PIWYESRGLVIGLGGCGNAWKISEETTDGTRAATFVINGAEVVWYKWPDGDWWKKREHDVTAEWEPARLKRAARQTMLMLAEHEARSKMTLTREQQHARDMDDIISGRIKFSETLTPGQVFLFALQLHRHGETEDAETLAAHLAQVFGADAVEASARVALAEAFYRSAYWRFRASKDWGRFYAEVQKVVEEGPEGWAWLPGLREMSRRFQFTDEEQVLIKNWEMDPAFSHSSVRATFDFPDTPWLVPESWLGHVELVSKSEQDIRALGMEALPMLIALCDEFPVKEEALFGGLPFPHPLLRAEKARETLKRILPKSAMENGGKSVKDKAAAFYETHKDASPEALALLYVFMDFSINTKPFEYLRKRAQTKRIPEFEAFAMSVPFDAEDYGRDELVPHLTKNVIDYAARHKDEKLLRGYADRLDTFAGECKEKHTHGNYIRIYNEEETAKIQAKLRGDAQKLRGMASAIAENNGK
ncbi:MAG: hypothetical protein FWF96_07310, partial [Kiritimatiellaeota bacterium]|nr:hypothetical protein [Kiritimatiellota bacterium]